MGHGAVGLFLERIGSVETAKCWWCGQAEQSEVHLYAECRKWRKERRVLKRELRKQGIGWQRRKVASQFTSKQTSGETTA